MSMAVMWSAIAARSASVEFIPWSKYWSTLARIASASGLLSALPAFLMHFRRFTRGPIAGAASITPGRKSLVVACGLSCVRETFQQAEWLAG